MTHKSTDLRNEIINLLQYILYPVKLIKHIHEPDHKLNVSLITIKTDKAYKLKIYDTYLI